MQEAIKLQDRLSSVEQEHRAILMHLDSKNRENEEQLKYIQRMLIDDLHIFFAGGQRQADQAQRVLAILQPGRHQRARARQRLGVVEDQRRIHQHLAVVAHQRRRLDHSVDAAELVEGAEDRERAMLELQSEQLERDRDAPRAGRRVARQS